MSWESQAADYIGPMAGNAGALDVTATSTTYALPSAMKPDTFWRWLANDNDVFILFGTDDTVSVDDTATSTTSGSGPTTISSVGGGSDDIPRRLVAGIPESFKIPPGATHFAIKCASGNTGRLEFDEAERA